MQYGVLQSVIENAPRGANLVCEWRRDAKVRKGVADLIQKDVRMVGRVGLDYEKLGAVQAKRENGELPEQAKPIWNGKGQWIFFPFLFEHVDKKEKYVRMYYGTNERVQPRVRWLRNGVEVPFENVECDLLASEKRDERDGDCFCVKLNDLLRVGKDTDYTEIETILPTTTTVSAQTSDVSV